MYLTQYGNVINLLVFLPKDISKEVEKYVYFEDITIMYYARIISDITIGWLCSPSIKASEEQVLEVYKYLTKRYGKTFDDLEKGLIPEVNISRSIIPVNNKDIFNIFYSGFNNHIVEYLQDNINNLYHEYEMMIDYYIYSMLIDRFRWKSYPIPLIKDLSGGDPYDTNSRRSHTNQMKVILNYLFNLYKAT